MIVLLITLLLSAASFAVDSAAVPSEVVDCEHLYESLMEDPPAETEAYIALSDEALACYGTPTEETASRVSRIHHFRAEHLTDNNRFEETLATVDSYFARFQEYEGDTADWDYRMHQWRAFVYFFTGDLLRSASSYAAAFPHARAQAPQHAALIAGEAGLIYYLLGDYTRSQYYLDRGFDLMAEADDEDIQTLGSVPLRLLGTQAALLLEWGEASEPMDLSRIREAQDVARTILERIDYRLDHNESVSSFIRLGQAARILGDYADAEAYYEQALEASKLQQEVHARPVIYTEHARLLLDQRRYAEAREKLESASGAVSPTAYRVRRAIAVQYGRTHYLAGELEESIPHFEEAIAHAEAERSAFRATEWSALRKEWNEPYRMLVSVYMGMDQPADALAALSASRARYLHDVQLQTRLLDELSADKRATFDRLTAELAEVQRMQSETAGSERLELLNEEARLIAARDTLVKLESAPSVPTIDELQEALDARDQTLLSYFIISSRESMYGWEDASSYVFMISADTMVTEPIDLSNDELRELMTEVSPLLTEGGESLTLNASAFSLEPLHTLHQRLVAPVAEHLTPGERLVIIPDQDLFALPFGLLLSEPTQRFQYANAPYLLRHHPLTVEVAERLLLPDETPRPATDVDVLALGRTHFGDASRRIAATSESQPAVASLVPLPAVRNELESIRSLFRSTLTALDEEATERTLLNHIDQSKIVHLASHVELNAAHPFRNAISLSPDLEDEDRLLDGQFTLSKLGQRSVPVELVVLSGCDTARGPLLAGEGMASLQMGFRSLGVRSSLATLWLVNDESSAELMTHFYRNLRDGKTKDVALQEAQLQFLADAPGVVASPFFWAAPVLYGSPDVVELRPQHVLPPWVFAMGGALFLFVIFVAYRRRPRPSFA